MTSYLTCLLVVALCCSASGLCPAGFVQSGLSCYYFSSEALPWISSQEACNQAFFPTQAYLVEINDQTENRFLFQHAQALKKTYWVGASDLQITGTYRWIMSGKVIKVSDGGWAPGQPNGGGITAWQFGTRPPHPVGTTHPVTGNFFSSARLQRTKQDCLKSMI